MTVFEPEFMVIMTEWVVDDDTHQPSRRSVKMTVLKPKFMVIMTEWDVDDDTHQPALPAGEPVWASAAGRWI